MDLQREPRLQTFGQEDVLCYTACILQESITLNSRKCHNITSTAFPS